jgi:hypothetical protein
MSIFSRFLMPGSMKAAVTPRNEVDAVKPKRGRPEGSKNKPSAQIKGKPGRPKGSKNKGKRGRPKGKVGRPAKKAGKAISLKGYVSKREAKRMVKEGIAAFRKKLPGIIKREVKKLLR